VSSPDGLRAVPGLLRWLLVGIGAGAALLVYLMGRRPPSEVGGRRLAPCDLGDAAASATGSRTGGEEPRDDGELLARLEELRAGDGVGRWRLVEIRGRQRGAIPLVLATADGTRFRVDILRRDPDGPRGPAETESLAIHLADVAPGTRTPEEQGLGAMTLAVALAGAAPPSWLLTLRERRSRFPG